MKEGVLPGVVTTLNSEKGAALNKWAVIAGIIGVSFCGMVVWGNRVFTQGGFNEKFLYMGCGLPAFLALVVGGAALLSAYNKSKKP